MKQKKNLICNWWLWNWLQRGERDILGQLQFTWLDAHSANVVALRYSHFIEGKKLVEMGIRTRRNTSLSGHFLQSSCWGICLVHIFSWILFENKLNKFSNFNGFLHWKLFCSIWHLFCLYRGHDRKYATFNLGWTQNSNSFPIISLFRLTKVIYLFRLTEVR